MSSSISSEESTWGSWDEVAQGSGIGSEYGSRKIIGSGYGNRLSREDESDSQSNNEIIGSGYGKTLGSWDEAAHGSGIGSEYGSSKIIGSGYGSRFDKENELVSQSGNKIVSKIETVGTEKSKGVTPRMESMSHGLDDDAPKGVLNTNEEAPQHNALGDVNLSQMRSFSETIVSVDEDIRGRAISSPKKASDGIPNLNFVVNSPTEINAISHIETHELAQFISTIDESLRVQEESLNVLEDMGQNCSGSVYQSAMGLSPGILGCSPGISFVGVGEDSSAKCVNSAKKQAIEIVRGEVLRTRTLLRNFRLKRNLNQTSEYGKGGIGDLIYHEDENFALIQVFQKR